MTWKRSIASSAVLLSSAFCAGAAAVLPVMSSEADDVRTAYETTYASVSSYGGIRAIRNAMIPKELWVSDAEAKAWSERRKAEWDALGYKEKGTIHPGHWFKRWVDRFWDSHREYFGLLPNGERGVQVEGLPAWLKTGSKMCVSNEAVVDQLIEDWKKVTAADRAAQDASNEALLRGEKPPETPKTVKPPTSVPKAPTPTSGVKGFVQNEVTKFKAGVDRGIKQVKAGAFSFCFFVCFLVLFLEI